MKAFLITAILLLQLYVAAQPVKDYNGLTGQVVDLHVNKIYKVTYVQVVFDFDSVTWGVYLINGVYDDAAKVVAEGNLLKMKAGAELYPMSDDWKYISNKQWKDHTK